MLPIYLINLDRDTDRLARMREQLAFLGLAFERFQAVNGSDLPEAVRPYFGAHDLSPGEVGCYASHLMLHHRIAESGVTSIVLEDDLVLPLDLPRVLSEILEVPGWDVMRLSNPPKWGVKPIAPLASGYHAVRYSRIPNTTGAYAITPEGARKFLAFWPRTRAIDEDMRRPWICGLETMGVYPAPIRSNIGPSTVEQMGGRVTGRRKKDPWAGIRSDFGRHGWRVAYNIRRLGLMDWARFVMAGRRAVPRVSEDPAVERPFRKAA